jgi:N-acetylglucosamine-6-phosphate deacetylase
MMLPPTLAKEISLTGAEVLFPGEGIRSAPITIAYEAGKGKISALGGKTADNPPSLNLQGYLIAPGLIDLQLNGAFGADFTTEPSTIWQVAERLPALGLTSFLPTVITSPLSVIEFARQQLLAGYPSHTGLPYTEPLGLHIEGPFLNPAFKGAHRVQYLTQPNASAVQHWSVENGVALVTLAPELQGAESVIELLSRNGIIVSMGHSDATYEQAMSGVQAGVRMATHLFNAMRPIHHREPGIMVASLAAPLAVGIIPDGIHVHPALLHLVCQAKRRAEIVIVTDAMAALGCPPGVYKLADKDVFVDASSARLADGTLAGSVVPPLDAVQNYQQYTHCSLVDAWYGMSTAPADLLSRPDKGRIVPGADADLLVLHQTTSGLQLAATITRGQLAYCTDAKISQFWKQTYDTL